MDDFGVPPQALEFEESVLAGIFIEPTNAGDILEELEPHHFYKTAHSKIFGLAADLYRTGITPDLAAVHQAAKEKGLVEEVGGASYIARLVDVPIPSNTEHYILKIKEKYSLRKSIEICNAITKRCFKDGGDASEVIDLFQQQIYDLGAGVTGDNVESMGSMIKKSFADYSALYEASGAVTGIPTGFKSYDNLLSGLQKTDLIILAARPSMGKTSLALQAGFNAAKDGIPVLIFSLEMSKRQLRDKAVAIKTGIDTTKFRKGGFSIEDRKKIEAAQDAMFHYPLYIDDTAALHWREIRRRARKYKSKYGIELIIVDHLQLVDHDKRDNRNVELGQITGGFKATAKDLDIPLMVLSQLNRNLEQRSDKRPILADLRESGNIEQDADVVSFLYRPDYYDEEADFEGQTELITRKHRNGPTGLTTLQFHPLTASFRSMAPSSYV